MIEQNKMVSNQDHLPLGYTIAIPETSNIKGIVLLVHGMTEHRHRYLDFMTFLSNNGYICLIYDQRGHGESIYDKKDLGYFYKNGSSYMVEDLHQFVIFIKEKFPNRPFYLFSHSMGTLVTRMYLKAHDNELDGLILCGPPFHNKLAPMGKIIANMMGIIKGDHYRSKLLKYLSFFNFNKGFEKDNNNAWLTSTSTKAFDEDPNCGFIFTINGFYYLFDLIQKVFSTKDWRVTRPTLPIFIIAGEKDPVIGDKRQFAHSNNFLKDRGYSAIRVKLYPSKRHELLHEDIHIQVYQDILDFIENEYSTFDL